MALKRDVCRLLFYLVLFFPGALIFSQKYTFQNFDLSDNPSSSLVYSIAQDSAGWLWISTGEGLSRFNGFHFSKIGMPDFAASDIVTSMFHDGQNLWFGTNEGLIFYYDGKSFMLPENAGEKFSRITQISMGPEGKIWALTYTHGIVEINSKDKRLRSFQGMKNLTCQSFALLKEGDVMVGTDRGLSIYYFSDSKEIKFRRELTDFPSTQVTAIHREKEGEGYFIATENDGIYYVEPEKEGFGVQEITQAYKDNLVGIKDVFEDQEGNLWMASYGNGLIKLNLSDHKYITEARVYNKENGFPANNVRTLFEDREGNIWAGNFGGGITRVNAEPFSFISFKDDPYGKNVFSILNSGGFYWIGTDKGLIQMELTTRKIRRFYNESKLLPKDSVTSLFSFDGRTLWIGTATNGVYRLNMTNGQLKKVPLGNDRLKNSVSKITGDHQRIWIGTKKGLGCYEIEKDSIHWYSIFQGGLPHNIIHDLYIDSKSRLWITCKSSILSFIDNQTLTRIPIYSAAGIMSLGPVVENQDSTIWVGSNGSGIFMINPDSVFNMTQKEGLMSDYCYALVTDMRNDLWIVHREGLSILNSKKLFIKNITQFKDAPEPLIFNQNAAFKDNHGNLLFGTEEGIIVYDQLQEQYRNIPPLVSVTSILVNDKKIDPTDEIHLPPGNYKLEIHFIGINLKNPSDVTYQHILEGYSDWSEINHDTTETFYKLTNGKFRFILKASNGEGMISENPVSIRIMIQKPIWKVWWFYLVTAFFVALLNYIHLKKRERVILAENRLLEEKVKERTREIELQKNEIEKQRDLIKEKNYDITSSIIYASYIQDTIISSHSFFDKTFPENFILSKPKDIVSGDFYWMAEKDEKVIFTVADGTGHGVPGAFISLLGITFLDEIVNTQGITNSKEIIALLRERVIKTLAQRKNHIPTPDGMDISLCVLDKGKKSFQFTGAMNDMLYFHQGRMKLLKADRVSVCIPLSNKGTFTMEEINYQKGDILYLFTDGYKDQFGGPQDKKYLACHFYNSLAEIHSLPMQKQKEILEKRLRDWMGDGPQTDDITIIGIRL